MLSRREFKDVVQSSHAFTHTRSSGRLQALLDSALDAIYSYPDRVPPSATGSIAVASASAHEPSSNNSRGDEERKMSPRVHPFYKGLTLQDAILVDKTLREHRVPTLNTRIECHGDARARSFTVFQAIAASATESQVLQMPDRRHVRLIRGDYEPALSRMLQAIRAASGLATCIKPQDTSSSTSGATDSLGAAHSEVAQSVAAFFATGDVQAHHTAMRLWTRQQVSAADPLAFVVRVCALPRECDPLHARGAIESFAAIRNDLYQSHTEALLKHHIALVQLLPFGHLMDTDAWLSSVTVECLDLVMPGRRIALLPLRLRAQAYYAQTGAQTHQRADERRRHKLLFLVNCMERFATGLATSAKLTVLDAFVSASVLESVRLERHRVAYFAFVCEDVLAPGTLVFLQELERDGDGSSKFTLERDDVVWLPPAFATVCSDNGDTSDAAREQQRRWRQHSSFGKRAERWYAPGASYSTTFAPAVATALEECRRLLLGLYLSLCEQAQRCVAVATGSAEQSVYRFALAYWASALRSALFALVFYSKTQRRWDDARMQAQFMVLHMLLYNGDAAREDAEVQMLQPSAVSDETTVAADPVELLVTLATARRGSTGIPQQPGVVTSVRLHFPVSDERTWLERAKLRSRTWLQQIQWIQITGDSDVGNALYRAHSSVSDRFLLCQDHILSKLAGEPSDAKAFSSSLSSSAATAKPSSSNSSKSSSEATSSFVSVQAARNSVSALLNASSFGLETLWIPPVLELCAPDTSAKEDKDAQSSTAHPESQGAEETIGDTAASEQDVLPRVTLRVLGPDLASAIEAAVLALGPLETHSDASM